MATRHRVPGLLYYTRLGTLYIAASDGSIDFTNTVIKQLVMTGAYTPAAPKAATNVRLLTRPCNSPATTTASSPVRLQ